MLRLATREGDCGMVWVYVLLHTLKDAIRRAF